MDEPIRLSYKEAILYVVLINSAIGIVFGLIPLFMGILRNKKKYGIIGFISSIVSGALLGIFLVFSVNTIFVWLILESKVIRKIVASVSVVAGLFTAVFGFLRMYSTPPQFPESAIGEGINPIAFGLALFGFLYIVIGIILIILSVRAKSATDSLDNFANHPSNS